MIDKKTIEQISKASMKEALKNAGLVVEGSKPSAGQKKIEDASTKKDALNEQAQVLIPKSYINKSEAQSQRTKEAHETLYKGYVDTYNKTTSNLQAASKAESNSNSSAWRSLKNDQTYNMNASKFHELYFGNVGDVTSKIAFNSVPYMRLQRDFGTFDNWQYDFIACAMAARNGWAMTVYEPYTNTYQNVLVDSHNVNIPLGCIPVIVLDMWEHAYYRDYVNDKRLYVNATMKELNWQVIEARMTVAENSMLKDLWLIQPVVSNEPSKVLVHDVNHQSAPIDQRQIEGEPAQVPGVPETPAPATTVGPDRVPFVGVPPYSGRRV